MSDTTARQAAESITGGHQPRAVRVGVVGLGSMGRRHAQMIAEEVPRLQLAAVCDREADVARAVGETHRVPYFDEPKKLLSSGTCEALVISTPHYRHVVFAAPALSAGLHVLIEKPVAVSIEGARRLNRAYSAARQQHPKLVFAAMFQQRLMPIWQRLKQLVDDGTIGTIRRVSWTVTDWFRTDAYYRQGGWRGTWRGEGGGVLMNQAPHNLDLLLWLTGLDVARITAVARPGVFHPIEVEDELSAVLEFKPVAGQSHGAIGHFITSTGEAPGLNRLEIVGSHGTVIAENGTLRLRKLAEPADHMARTGEAKLRNVPTQETVERVGEPESTTYTDQTPYRRAMLANFAEAILSGAPVAAPGEEGEASLELANAMLLSGFDRKPVELPLDEMVYQDWLLARMQPE